MAANHLPPATRVSKRTKLRIRWVLLMDTIHYWVRLDPFDRKLYSHKLKNGVELCVNAT